MLSFAFVGSKGLGVRVLEQVYSLAPDHLCGIVTVDDTQDTRCALTAFANFAERTNTPLQIIKRSSQLEEAIASFKPDLCLVVGWYWVLSSSLLRAVPNGWYGIHASLLPRYRGGSPLVWAVINGDEETGISLFRFDEGMDTGDIVAQARFGIGGNETIADVLAKAEDAAAELVSAYHLPLLAGNAPHHTQDHTQATYVALRKPEDGRIDWHWSAPRLYNFVRAQTHPYPGAFCTLPSGVRMRIWKASVFAHPYWGSPGQVSLVAKDHVVVTCANATALCLYTVQLDGGEEQSAPDVVSFGQRLQ